MPHGFTLLASNCNASGNESTDRVEMRKDVVMEMHYRQHLQMGQSRRSPNLQCSKKNK
jgi:hypothetical protein